MPPHFPHLFVDISAHGLGHLAQVAPVLNQLAGLLPDLRLTLRSALPVEKLRQRIHASFQHIVAASDFGYVMIDAVSIDLPATAAAYRQFHADFPGRIAAEARLLQTLGADMVLTDVAYLPLAGAQRAGIPAVALCSLNWADLFVHYFGRESWANSIHGEMLAAYRSATFLRTTPGMPMPALTKIVDIGTIAAIGQARGDEIRQKLGAGRTARLVLVALGGIPMRLPIETWPAHPDTRWLVPAAWQPARADCHAIEALDMPFGDLLRSVDVVVTKPGYGTFAEAACNGTAVIYQRRDDWPEQDCLIEWLHQHGRCTEVSATMLATGQLEDALALLQDMTAPPLPVAAGASQAARYLADRLA